MRATSRRTFLKLLASSPLAGMALGFSQNERRLSDFSKKLKPLGRRLEIENEYMWCNSPIDGPDGKVHLFFSRWSASRSMSGWLNGSEIAHAVAPSAEAPFEVIQTVLAPRGGNFWDATTCHNPHIQKVGDQYALFYLGNSNGKTNTKRIGLALSNSLDGPWKRPDQPLILPGETGAWDDHCTTNPAFVRHPNGEYWLFYKSWNTKDYETTQGPVRGNRKYGLAVADALEGPYIKYAHNPILDFSMRGNNQQLEDAFVWMEKGKFKMLARDMGFFAHDVGLYLESIDGLTWSNPEIAFEELKKYAQEPAPPAYLKKYGRLERPQLLIRKGQPSYLFTAAQGGKFGTSSSFLFRIEP